MEEDINFDLQFDDDEDDCILVQAVDASVANVHMSKELSYSRVLDEQICEEDEKEGNISIGCDQLCESTQPQSEQSGFDRYSGQLWIYPTNYPVRDYQYNIVQQALFRNTLVVLPTGLGKTFIAAVVMYNIYRWFPQGKVVFMAPTKPLVAQQIHACYNIMGIPKIDTIEMTGNMHPNIREKAWKQKRVIFLTPQVMTNDISRGSCVAKSIKCVVVDEAHKALGNHAYCQVIRELVNFTAEFRVLALSATPGSDLKAVQKVMDNLLISHIEMRSEDSIDIRPYTHERKVEKFVVPLGEELSGIRLKYIQIMQMVIQRLIRQRVLYNREATKLSKFLILKARDEYRQNPPQNLEPAQYGNIEADFALAMSIYHGFELLQLHGLRSLYNFLLGIKNGNKGYGRTRFELTRCSEFNDIMELLYSKFTQSGIGNKLGEDKKVIVGHPKMQRLEEVVLAHFKSFQAKNQDTRVMIFSQYRDSVEEIRSILDQHQPLVKVMAFIGQSSNGKSTKGFTQKEQLRVMQEFRVGGFNTLVSTCVGEEGLDIGDVDLIVCFDAHKSPIRLVQRMGRTGRRREGRIVMLVTEGKEEQIYNQSLYSKKSIHKAILNGARTLQFYAQSPRLIPEGSTPKSHKMFITVKQDSQQSSKSPFAKPDANGKRKSLGKHKKISDVFSKQVQPKKSDSERDREEYEEIKREFSQLSFEAKQMPHSKCMILKQKHKETESAHDGPPPEQIIELSEWMPWQNRLQQTHVVGHSLQAMHLVKDAEFIELQQSIGESGNAYGLEMDLYVNEKDIFKAGHNHSVVAGQESMKSFLIPSQNQGEDHQSKTLRPLQQLEGKVYVKSPKRREKGKSMKSSSLFTRIKDTDVSEEDAIEMNGGRPVNGVKKKKKKSKRKLLEPGSCHFGECSSSGARAKLAKKKSILEILTSNIDKDNEILDEDFDTTPDGEVFLDAKKRSSGGPKDLIHHIESSFESSCTKDVDNAEGSNCENSAVSLSRCKQIHIPTPPRIEEVADLIAAVEDPLDFANIDLFSIVSDWEKTSPFLSGLTHSTPLNKSFLPKKGDDEERPCKESHKRMNDSHTKSENLHHIKKSKTTSSVFGGTNKSIHNEQQSLGDADMKSNEEEFLFPRFQINDAHELHREESLEQHIRKSPSFKSNFKNKISRSSEKFIETEHLHSVNQKEETDVDLHLQGSPHVSKNLFPMHDNDQKCCQKQNSSVEPVETPHIEPAFRNSENMSMMDMLESDLKDVNVEFETFSGDKIPVEKNKNRSSVGNKSLCSTSFATFTQAMACLHSSSSESNQHEEEEEMCLDSQVRDCKGRSKQQFLVSKKNILAKTHPISIRKSMLPSDRSHHSEGDGGPTFNLPQFSTESHSFQEASNVSKESIYNSSQTFSPLENSPSIHQAPDSDEDLFHPQFELGFDLDSEIVPPTPEKNKTTAQLFSAKTLTALGLNNRKGKGDNFSCRDEAGMDSVSEVTKRIETGNVKSMTTMDESDLGLLEEMQNMEALNIDAFVGDISNHSIDSLLDITNTAEKQADVTYPKDLARNIFPTRNPGHDTSHPATPSPTKKKELSFSTYNPSTSNRNQNETNLSLSTLSEKCDIMLEDKWKNTMDLTQPQSALKKKKLSLKKSNSKEDVVDTNSAFTSAVNTVSKASNKIKDCSMNKLISETMRRVSTPKLQNFSDFATSGITKVAHLTPFRNTAAQEDIDSEESFIIRRKKKGGRKLDLTTDCDSDEEVSFQRGNSYRKQLNVSDVYEKRKTREGAMIFLDDEEVEDNDFQGSGLRQRESKVSPIPHKKQSKKSSKKIFIDDEAVESGEERSSDEAEDHEDCYEGSFIDSRMEMTQTQGTDMMAVYLKSVKSPPLGVAKVSYRRNLKQINSAIYSQALPEDQGQSEYEEDSFCVASDDEDIDMTSETFSPPIVERRKKMSKKVMKGKRRLRVLTASSSDDDDDEDDVPKVWTQEFSPSLHKAPVKSLMISSEEEQAIGHGVDEHSSLPIEPEEAKGMKSGNGSNLGLHNVIEDCIMSVPQHRIDGSERMKSPIPENDSAGNFDLLDIDEFFEDIDVIDNAVQVSDEPRTSTERQATKGMTGFGSWQNKSVQRLTDNSVKGNLDFLDGKTSSLNYTRELETKESRFHNSPTFSHSVCTTHSENVGASVSSTVTVDQDDKELDTTVTKGQPLSRCERLKKQREKQERYRSKLAQVQQQTASLADGYNKNETSCISSRSMPEITETENSTSPGPLQILVDSREISGAQEIISALRLKHKVTVTARQLSTCDYILSNYMAVDRLQWSEFGNSGNRTKLSTRLCDMQAQYQKCVLIIQADRVKSGQEKLARPAHHTKYLDKILSFIMQTGIKIYFTDNGEQTAALLFELCEIEQRKGRSFTAPTSLNSRKEEMLNFVTSFPKVTMAEGLNLVHRFKSIAEMVSSPAKLIQERGRMPDEKAQWIYNFLRFDFDVQMTPASKK